MRFSLTVGIAVVILSLLSNLCEAGLNDPISFTQAGTVTLTLDESGGGFDHILELASVLGPVGTPVMALTESFAPSADVLGFTPASINDSVVLGSFTSGEEIIFRLTNVESARLGTPGVLGIQVFSGTASSNNQSPADYFTYIDFLSPTTIAVYFEDAFATSATDPDPVNTFLSNGYDVKFTLTLAIPEPATLGLLISGLALVGVRPSRRS